MVKIFLTLSVALAFHFFGLISPLNTIHSEPSSFVIGWLPPAKSMMLRRTCPDAAESSRKRLAWSGPRARSDGPSGS